MHIKKIVVKNFRLLKDVTLSLEEKATVIVGRNNAGKTSLTELFRRIVSDNSAVFALEDFSLACHDDFWNAFQSKTRGENDKQVREKLPFIQLRIQFSYEVGAPQLGALSDFVIDLDTSSSAAIADVKFSLKEGMIEELFAECGSLEGVTEEIKKANFCKLMKERVSKLFAAEVLAVDPSDETNTKKLEMSNLKRLLMSGFISAQRGLDDMTHKENDKLGAVLEKLFTAAGASSATVADQTKAKEIETVVKDIQGKIDNEFNENLNKLIPALRMFGYPGLHDSELHTETVLDAKKLLGNHTKLRYAGANGIGLPETYNGLGARNLILILFQLYEFFKLFQGRESLPGVHLIFIEEPEAHLHPQMQEVFIRQIEQIIQKLKDEAGANGWPVQVVITTHSTHMANEASFESVRYFLKKAGKTVIKDLKADFCDTPNGTDKEFLHKFLTLTKCDLFFADKAILIEGASERLMMPEVVKKIDASDATLKLATQYVAVVEVGGAYAHLFYKLLDFLELQTLVITDLDSVNGRKACKVSVGTKTSNSAIKKWFADDNITPAQIIAKTDADKTSNYRRIAYQIPEAAGAPCGRSFEGSFIFANPTLFGFTGAADEAGVWDLAEDIKKTDFALDYGIRNLTWTVPKYMKDGLVWLARTLPPPPPPAVAPTSAAVAPVATPAVAAPVVAAAPVVKAPTPAKAKTSRSKK